ncbi:hypothetical protein FPS10_05255, partial [Pseudoruegeria sp. M32A2M]|nr:hypothetical protein [Pseudoruegeria sp. M32A2M]
MKLTSFAYTAAIGVLVAMPALAQPFESKGVVGDWGVFFNAATGGCFVERQTEDGVVMQMGTQADMLGVEEQNYGFLAVYVPIPTDIQPDEKRHVQFQLGETVYGGDAVGAERDGYFGGYAVANRAKFIDDIANLQTMTVNPETDRAYDIDLTAPQPALEALRALQPAMST